MRLVLNTSGETPAEGNKMRHFGRRKKRNEKLLAYLTPDEARGAPVLLTQYERRLPRSGTQVYI